MTEYSRILPENYKKTICSRGFQIRKTFLHLIISLNLLVFQDQLTEFKKVKGAFDSKRQHSKMPHPPSSSPFFIPSWRASQHVISEASQIILKTYHGQISESGILYKGHATAGPTYRVSDPSEHKNCVQNREESRPEKQTGWCLKQRLCATSFCQISEVRSSIKKATSIDYGYSSRSGIRF